MSIPLVVKLPPKNYRAFKPKTRTVVTHQFYFDGSAVFIFNFDGLHARYHTSTNSILPANNTTPRTKATTNIPIHKNLTK